LKISDVLGYSLSSPYGDGNVFGQPKGVKSIGLIEVQTNSGHIGIGETYAAVYAPKLIKPIAELIKSIVIGMDPRNIDDINKSLKIPFISSNGIIQSVLSALDIALWDINGKIHNKPVFKLLNESIRDSVKVYASGGSVAMNSEQIHNDVESILRKGYKSYKMRVGVQPWKNDLERVSAARTALGDNNQLMIDAIMGTLSNHWDLDTAKIRANDLITFRPYWLEEPLPPENYFDYQELHANTKVPLAMGESFTGLNEFLAYISGNCIDFIQPDVTHCGGFSNAKKIIAVAKKYNMPVALHVWGSAISIISNLHLAIAIDEIEWLEVPQVKLEMLSDEIKELISIENGSISVVDSSGLGLNISTSLKNKYPFVPGSGYKVPSI